MANRFDAHRWFLWTSIPFLALQAIFSFFWRTPSVSLPFHDIFFVISQSRFLMLLAAFFLFIAVIYFILMKMQRRLHKGLSLFHYVVTVISILILFFGMVFSGFFTASDSEDVNAVLFDFKRLNKAIAISAYLLIFSQFVFVINCLIGIFNVKFIKQ